MTLSVIMNCWFVFIDTKHFGDVIVIHCIVQNREDWFLRTITSAIIRVAFFTSVLILVHTLKKRAYFYFKLQIYFDKTVKT